MVNKTKSESSGNTRKNQAKSKETTTSRTYRKSPAREKRQSPARSRAKTPPSVTPPKSPGRKSPSRKNPGRKSPSRETAPTTDTRKSPRRGRERKSAVLETDTDSDGVITSETIKEKPKATVRGRSRKLDLDDIHLKDVADKSAATVPLEASKYSGLARRSTRISHYRDEERIVHLKPHDNFISKLSELSRKDDITRISEDARHSEPKSLPSFKTQTEFGGYLGALLLMVVFPVSALVLNIICNEYQCSFTQMPNISKYKHISAYIDPTSILVYLGHAIALALLCALPFGGPKLTGMLNKQGKLEYRMNGLFCFFVIFAAIFAMEIYGIPAISFIDGKTLQLATASILFAFLTSFHIYLRSFFVPLSALNSHAATNSKIYNFWMGRELNPRICGIDLKMYFLRLAVITTMILISSSLFNGLNITELKDARDASEYLKIFQSNSTSLVLFAMQAVYFIEMLIFEKCLLTTFEVQYEGAGSMCALGYSVYPFIIALIQRYVVHYNIHLPVWQLIVSVVVFLVGYVLYRGSNNQKNAFRQNAYNPALSHLETIPTPSGKKLLISGYWGFVRKPNYLGDILISMSFIPFTFWSPPTLVSFLTLLLLVHRTTRDNARCKQRYGAAWDRYCQRVKYVLVPKVY